MAILTASARAEPARSARGGVVDPDFVSRYGKLLPMLPPGSRALATPPARPPQRFTRGALDDVLTRPGVVELTFPLFSRASVTVAPDGASVLFALGNTPQTPPVRAQVRSALARLSAQLLDAAF